MSNKVLVYILIAIAIILAGGFTVWRLAGNKNQPAPVAENHPATPEGGQNDKNPSNETASSSPATACQRDYNENTFKTAKVNTKNRQVEIDVKDFGKITVALDDQAAPKTVENFLKLTNAGFYDCLTFHRIVQDFVVQGGDPQGDGTGGPGFTVPAEIKLLHKKGAIAMARLGDEVNPKKDSSGSQFYIALKDLPQLDGNYTVFGQVVSGNEVVEKIGQLPADPASGKPVTPVVMEKVKIIK